MKKALYLILFAFTFSNAQIKYYTKSGILNFEASVPSFEEVKASNTKVTSILNIENGEIAVLALVNGFHFKIALMQEHFNENYAESNKFPKASFKGKIENFQKNTLEGTKEVLLIGKLTFHGKTNNVKIPAKITSNKNKITLTSYFKLLSSDYEIQIPTIIRKKVAEEVLIEVTLNLQPK